MRKQILKIMLAGFALFCGYSSRADLSAVVTPGHTFTQNDFTNSASVIAALNAGAQPTIQIVGSVGGSNSVAPGSITLVQLSSSILDAKTLNFGGAGGTIQIAAQGVFTNNLNTNDWSWPLSQPSPASPVKLNFDAMWFLTNSAGLAINPAAFNPQEFSTNNGTLNLNLDPNYFGTNSLGLTLTNFTSSEFTISDTSGLWQDIPHHLGRTPTIINWVFVCKTAENGYSAGDEVNCSSVVNNTSGQPNFNYGGNSTNVFLVRFQNNSTRLYNKSSGAVFSIDANWKLKCYAM